MDYCKALMLNFICMLLNMMKGVVSDATLNTPPSNVSVLLGRSATFNCAISGTQVLGEDVQFYKTSPSPSTLIGLNSNVRNTTKYNVTGTYSYSIHHVILEDEGKYECVLFPNALEAYLNVVVAPGSHSLSWPNGRTNVQTSKPTNMTCTTGTSRPPAIHRWYKGSNDVTDKAVRVKPTIDNNGYGNAVSFMELTLTQEDYFAPFKCIADLPGAQDIVSAELRVFFSSATTKSLSANILLISLVFYCFISWF